MTVLQDYFRNQYDAYLKLKTQLELQDIEEEMFFENLSEEEELLTSSDYKDEYYKILKQEEII